MDMSIVLDNFAHATVLLFFLGMLAVAAKSDLDVPESIAKFLGLYFLFKIISVHLRRKPPTPTVWADGFFML